MGESEVHAARGTWRVAVVDDDECTRDLLEVMLDADPRFELVGVAGDGRTALSMVEWLSPTVVIIDLQVPGFDGLAALPEIRRRAPDCRIVVLSAFPDPCTLADVVVRGADLYLDKSQVHTELLPALAALGRLPVGAVGALR